MVHLLSHRGGTLVPRLQVEVLDMNFEGDTERMLDFFVAESDFYPQLDALCRTRVLEAFPKVAEESE